jgi:hypothetical protein
MTWKDRFEIWQGYNQDITGYRYYYYLIVDKINYYIPVGKNGVEEFENSIEAEKRAIQLFEEEQAQIEALLVDIK